MAKAVIKNNGKIAMKHKKDILFFVFTALLWGVIIGLGVIQGEHQAESITGESYE